MDAFVFSLNAMGTSLAYSTFLGGSCYDEGEDILVDSAGLTYVTRSTCSTNFPLANPIHMQLAGGNDVFVTNFNGERSGLAFSTFVGGTQLDNGHAIGLDDVGIAYIAGGVRSGDFPTVQGSFDRTFNSG